MSKSRNPFNESQKIIDLGMARFMIEALEERDKRIYALLTAIGDIIEQDTNDYVLYLLALEISADQTRILALRETLGLAGGNHPGEGQ